MINYHYIADLDYNLSVKEYINHFNNTSNR